jgi:hypothetical protein
MGLAYGRRGFCIQTFEAQKKPQVAELVLMVLISFNGMGFRGEPKLFCFQAPST